MVTGAGSGIGARIAVALAEAGADVALHSLPSPTDRVQQFADACRAHGRRAEVFAADFSDPSAAARVVDDAATALGRVDIVVNNAAIVTSRSDFDTLDQSLFERVLAVNVTAPFLASQAAARHMVRQGEGGRIVNIGSVHARQSAPRQTAYEVSKGAIHALTYSSAIQLGQHGITVNCVAPGAVMVERYADFDYDESWYVSRTPAHRLGTPDDIANAVLFLASPASGWITGETLFVDGGMTRRMPLVK